MNNNNVEYNEQDILNFYKQNYKAKICREIRYIDSIDDENKNKQKYESFQKACCCIRPKSLLIYSFFILAFACTGFFFAISRNDGYKAYKEALEKNISLINNDLPHEHETIKLVSYLTRNQSEDNECSYIMYTLGFCGLGNYQKYCTRNKYLEKKCNYMDYQYSIGYPYTCTFNNYKAGRCSEIQYNDYLKKTGQISYKQKINFSEYDAWVNLESFAYGKIWCKIGDYDQPIYLSFIILLVIFIILLIYDLILNKKTLVPGVKYYIVITLYMFFHAIFRIYAVLFFTLSYYGIFISFYYIKIFPYPDGNTQILDPFLDNKVEIYTPEDKVWKDKRINAFIFCGISFLLFIHVWILSFYKKLIHDYLTFNFDERNIDNNNLSEIYRKASIKVGKNNYNFDIEQNKDLYLIENRKNIKYNFKKTIFQKKNYYLKCNNLGLKTQLSWNELKYPDANEVFLKLGYILNLIYMFIFVLVTKNLWIFDNDPTFNYFVHLIDLGYQPKNYKYTKNIYELYPIIDKYIYVFHIILGIIIFLSIYKLAIFGGFNNIILIKISIFISIILALLNLASLVLSGIGGAFTLVSYFGFNKIKYLEFGDDGTLYVEYIIKIVFFFYLALLDLFGFIMCLQLISPLNKIKNETQKLETEKKPSEDIFKYMSLDNKGWILEAVNTNPNLPKHLFYERKDNPNPNENFNQILPNIQLIGQSPDTILCMEQNLGDILDEKQKDELQRYKNKSFNTKRIISGIIYNIIFSGITFILIIVLIAFSFNKNKNYKIYKDFFNQIEEINKKDLPNGINTSLPGYLKLFCDIGNIESGILISFLIFTIIFVAFEIFSLIVHKNIINLEGAIHKFLLLMNMAFYLIFKIFLPLVVLLYLLSLYVISESPKEVFTINNIRNTTSINVLTEEWDNKKISPFINIIKLLLIIFVLLLLKIKYCIIDYLNKNYEENVNEEEDENQNKKNDEINELNTSLTINNNNYITTIKLNHMLYLQKIGSVGKENIFKFKKVKINNITENFVYVRLGLNSVTDQISLAEWNYPELNPIFLRLGEMCNYIYIILFMSIILFKMHVKNELSYQKIKLLYETFDKLAELGNMKKPQFSKIFSIYGSFEKSFTESRFVLYLIQILVILIFMLKRIYFGGFGKICYLHISFILLIICSIQNIVFIILDFVIILLTGFSYLSFSKNKYEVKAGDIIEGKFAFQFIFNIIIFIINIKLFKENIALDKDYNRLKKEMIKFNKKEDNIDENIPNFKPLEFKYISLEGIVISIKEYRNDNLQRYLYYYSDNILPNSIDNKIPLDKENKEERKNNKENKKNNKEINKNNKNEISYVSTDKINNQDKITDIDNAETEKRLKSKI